MPKVSVIIPFNNVEPYIRQCLESVSAQTLEDIEIICVNDASEDSSRNVVEEFMQKDSRIKLIDLDVRKGQGYARNRAIEIAQGEYIGFVDSDDWVEPEMFAELYNKARENDNDITICLAREYDDINEKYILSDYYSLAPLERMGDNVFNAAEAKDELLDINVVLWNKIYKREYLERIGEKFPEGFIYEDLPFFFATFLPAQKIQIVWKNFYIYRVNRKNSTMQQFNKKILDRPPMVSLTYEKFKQFDFLNDIRERIQGWIINDLFHRYTLLKESYQREYFFLMKKIFENLEISNPRDLYWKSIYHFEGYKLVVNNNFEEFNQKLFTEYMDIHKLENRILSKLYNRQEVDKQIAYVYNDIGKTYNYTNEKANVLAQNISELESNAENEYKNIYEEISFNYDKTIEIFNTEINKVKSDSDGKNVDLHDKINYHNSSYDEKLSVIKNEVNTEISGLYSKISQDFEAFNAHIAMLESKIDELNARIEELSKDKDK